MRFLEILALAVKQEGRRFRVGISGDLFRIQDGFLRYDWFEGSPWLASYEIRSEEWQFVDCEGGNTDGKA